MILRNLETINILLRQRLELAEATIPPLNRQLQQLAALGGLNHLVFSGRVIQTQPYAYGLGPIDSGQVNQAVLYLPYGLGVAVWDSEVYSQFRTSSLGLEPGVTSQFLPFDECSSLLKALLLSQVPPLLADLNRSVRMIHG